MVMLFEFVAVFPTPAPRLGQDYLRGGMVLRVDRIDLTDLPPGWAPPPPDLKAAAAALDAGPEPDSARSGASNASGGGRRKKGGEKGVAALVADAVLAAVANHPPVSGFSRSEMRVMR